MLVVVYKKGKSGKRNYMQVFLKEKTPDRLLNLRARKPLIPNNYIIEEIGIGTGFIKKWKQKYKIKNHQVIE